MKTLSLLLYTMITGLYIVVVIHAIKNIKHLNLKSIKEFWYSPLEVDDED